MDQDSGKQIEYLAEWIKGFSIGLQSTGIDDGASNFKKAAKHLKRLAARTCGQGFICNGGDDCQSSHK